MTSSSGREPIVCFVRGFRRGGIRGHRAAIGLLALVCLLVLAYAREGAAGELSARADALSALREYAEAREISAAQAPAGPVERRFGGTPEAGGAADRYIDLRAFAER